jgi:uncharacterized protein
MMSRILFWLALVFLVMFAIRSKLRGMQQPRGPQAPPPPAAERAPGARQSRRHAALAEAEVMLCCAHCGVYYPASETVRAGGHDFCSPTHAKLPAAPVH